MSEDNLSVMTPEKETKHDQRSPRGGTPHLDRLLAEEPRKREQRGTPPKGMAGEKDQSITVVELLLGRGRAVQPESSTATRLIAPEPIVT
jgi:hypothetical protein